MHDMMATRASPDTASELQAAGAAHASANPSASPSANPSFSPLYRQIKGLITRSLQQGDWKPGELIPSEADLARRFGVSQGTVRKAVDELAAEGLLLRRQGRGTFVSTHHEERVKFRFLRLVPDATAEGGRPLPQPMDRQFLECRRVRASQEVARMLGIKTGESVTQIRRLLLLAGEPVVYEDIYLPGPAFRALTAERLESYRGPLYALFESEFATRMVRAEEKLRAVNADAQEAQLLRVREGEALLLVERLSFSYGELPAEYRRGLYNTRHHHYRNELN
ncbi:GntR family transcriptional regulator [Thiomonas bhubaneswarensis]|uniref:DNA-binding transcriptional regulator, GntR family n=1 Tax=Thiomonas bhubaneswarensis TaxID=339866 RepID=A0A0K6I3E0_9BURK|nr:GntR family transcriptional regulator [Thiomonas bhubaneswarensis]CUA97822.1 DNA-binding transcriptional regulator, GntR family [Thiomonas bhubaneswarensis]